MGKIYELKLENYNTSCCLLVEIIQIEKNYFLWKQIDNNNK